MVLPVTLDAVLATRSAVIVPDIIDHAASAAARARFTAYTRYTLVDRGSYEYIDAPDVPDLLALLGCGRTLVDARVVRLHAGDYLLARHDRPCDGGIEVVLDLSRESVPGAEVHYRQHGQVLFRMPSAPGSAAIVPRTASVSCNHTYISKLHRDAEIVRLVARYA
jgi:hypothetical protein